MCLWHVPLTEQVSSWTISSPGNSLLPKRYSRYRVGIRMIRPLTLLIVGELSEANSQCDSFCLVSSAGRSLSAESASSECNVSCVLRMSFLFLLYSWLLALTIYDLGSPALDSPTSTAGSQVFPCRILIVSPGSKGLRALLLLSKYSFCVWCLAVNALWTSFVLYVIGVSNVLLIGMILLVRRPISNWVGERPTPGIGVFRSSRIAK